MKPEAYWIERGDDVIGTDALLPDARQAATYRAIAEWIVAHRVTDLLDVGCNVAALSVYLDGTGWTGDYVGVDTNPHALAVAVKRAHVFPGDLRRLNFSERLFHAVVVKDVIEHLESYAPLSEAFRVAREYVVVATYMPWTARETVTAKHPDGYYTNTYAFGDIAALAERCGFSLVDRLDVSEATGWPNLVTFWKRRLGQSE